VRLNWRIMARKLRLEFPGACYHVINRGNYRTDIFRADTTKAAFESCLFEACQKSGWLLHAFVLMRNHYHLALETPKGNLVAGMHWLQVTFAIRFNRLRAEHGHLFQGRYKALLVEDGDPLGAVCHYIHLNPTRAGILPVSQLQNYRYSSYWYLRHPRQRPGFLSVNVALSSAGRVPDTSSGWDRYAGYLEWQMTYGPAGGSNAYANLSRGWALGSVDFKTALVRDHALVARTRAWESSGAKEIREREWAKALNLVLQSCGRSEAESRAARKSADWKLAIAAWMKTHTQASNGWLARRLSLGTPDALSHNLTRYRREIQPTDRLWRQLTSFSVT
jgi:REP-associated tyrosine transposase